MAVKSFIVQAVNVEFITLRFLHNIKTCPIGKVTQLKGNKLAAVLRHS
jgi:hypothetical protein